MDNQAEFNKNKHSRGRAFDGAVAGPKQHWLAVLHRAKGCNFLDGQYNTVFGRLTVGMDAIDKTAALGRETRWTHQSVYPEQARLVKVTLSD